MDLQTKHQVDKNLMGRLGAIIISVSDLLVTVLRFTNGVKSYLVV